MAETAGWLLLLYGVTLQKCHHWYCGLLFRVLLDAVAPTEYHCMLAMQALGVHTPLPKTRLLVSKLLPFAGIAAQILRSVYKPLFV